MFECAVNKNQPRLPCDSCKRNVHLKCLGSGFEISGLCRLCCADESLRDESPAINDQNLYVKLHEVIGFRGINIHPANGSYELADCHFEI